MLAHFNGHRIARSPSFTPYYYQTEAVQATERAWDVELWTKPLIVIPTGGGKTKVTGELCARAIERGERTLFLAHTKKLVEQPAGAFEEDFGCPSTIEMADQCADDAPMVFASVPTMVNRIKSGKWRPDTFGRIIMDEAHGALADGHMLVTKHFGSGGALICGCTATPRRGDKKDLLKFFDGIAYDKPIQDLFKEGFLVEPTIKLEPLGVVVKQAKPSDMSDEEIGEALEPYLGEAADRVIKMAVGRCGLSFLPLRKTARMFCEMLRERGLRCEYVGGDIEPREQAEIQYRLEMGKIDHVCNAQIWGVGVDIRPLNLLVDLRPTCSWTSAMQKWGRLTRTFDPAAPYAQKLKGTRWGKKKDALLVDFCFESERHSMVQRPAVMVAKDDEESKEITAILSRAGGGSLTQAVASACNEREATLKKRLEAMRGRSSREVSAMEFFLNQKRMDLVEYEPESKWELEPMTPSQKQMLTNSRIDLGTVQGKGHASKIIDMLMSRIERKLCTIGQATFAASLGHPDPYSMTFDEARRFLDQNSPNKKPWKKSS